MSYYAPSVPGSVVSQPTSQALVLANPSAGAVQYQHSTAVPISSHSRYMYSQPVQYGYPQSVPVYIQPQRQVVYAMPQSGYGMPATYSVPSYGGYGMPMATPQYIPHGGANVIIQEPGHRRRSRRRRHSYSGYPTYY